jgi:TM2 domain-containing membrane protein YozV
MTSEKSFVVALLLLILLGGIGAHRFYVGKPETAILFIFTLGGLGFWGLYDLIMIATVLEFASCNHD